MKNANNHFGSSNGSENFYVHNLSQIHYTDGVKDMAETCCAYWLIDLIVSHQYTKSVNEESFQVWVLKRVEEDVFIITASDGNKNQIADQQIPFSDFSYDTVTLWLIDNCLLLPNEY